MGDPEKHTRISISELSSRRLTSRDGSAHDGSSLPLNQWPSEPKPLLEDRLTFLFNMAYDSVLLYIPILLLVKTVFVIRAAKIDAGKSGLAGDPVSNYTLYLIPVNTQVCPNQPLV
jgi:hypothetical protein